MRVNLDLRLRIAAVLATVCIVVVGGLGLTLYMASNELEQSLVLQVVSEEMESLITRARSSSGPVSPGGPNLQYYVLDTQADFEDLPPPLRNLGPGHHNVGHGIDKLHVAVREVEGKRYVVATTPDSTKRSKAAFADCCSSRSASSP